MGILNSILSCLNDSDCVIDVVETDSDFDKFTKDVFSCKSGVKHGVYIVLKNGDLEYVEWES